MSLTYQFPPEPPMGARARRRRAAARQAATITHRAIPLFSLLHLGAVLLILGIMVTLWLPILWLGFKVWAWLT
jgi:hypothetical protein